MALSHPYAAWILFLKSRTLSLGAAPGGAFSCLPSTPENSILLNKVESEKVK
jgi:hypothetical protein